MGLKYIMISHRGEHGLEMDDENRSKFRSYSQQCWNGLPPVNPDFDDKYESVKTWWLEVDEGENPKREIGFSESGAPIVFGPIDRNPGVWTNVTLRVRLPNEDGVAARFDSTWIELLRKRKGDA